MKRIRHVYIQKDLESHSFLDLVLDSRDISLSLENICVQPPVVATEADERLGRLEVIRQIFWNTNVPKTVFCEFLPKFQYGRLFFDVVHIGQMHIALVHTVRVFIQYNTLL